ncbi:MAG: Do family serine endopeptidase [Candidatus Cyclobacteriaceae bacterium M3_2C_046]
MKGSNLFSLVFILLFYISCTGQNNPPEQIQTSQLTTFEQKQQNATSSGSYVGNNETQEADIPPALNFTEAAREVTPAVVHIISTINPTPGQQRQNQIPPQLRQFFNLPGPQRPQPRQGSGSGVIISEDGYIVTNNHVIADADNLQVTMNNNQTYTAEVIGTDPTTDLALVKIDPSNNLPFVPFGDIDQVEVGDWVLAVGNPFNLSSTVTAGIVSALSRSINILREQAAVEAFIQTDAAINPGNSGGALVNLDGELVGINTAIASPTGAYAGYGFAVPINLTRKVVNDLLNYGVVQRGYLGVFIRDINEELADEEDINIRQGVYVDSLVDAGAAEAAGIQSGDIIVEVEDQDIENVSQLQVAIAEKRPGDEIDITVLRNGNRRNLDVTLKNMQGNTELVRETTASMLDQLGIGVSNLSEAEQEQLGIDAGVRVMRIQPNGLIGRSTQMMEGFIIQQVDNQDINNVAELTNTLKNKSGGVIVAGVYPGNSETYYYAFGL